MLPAGNQVHDSRRWPRTTEELIEVQLRLCRTERPPWLPPDPGALQVTAAWVSCAPGAGEAAAGKPAEATGCPARSADDPAWAAAVTMSGSRVLEQTVLFGHTSAAYTPGLLALRIGPLLADVVVRLHHPTTVLIVDATGRDHPRRAGLAFHVGAVLNVPTVGVTHRPLVATGEWPEDTTGAVSPLLLHGEHVGFWLRSRAGSRPIAVHAAWRTDPGTALTVVRAVHGGMRTPAPLRQARRIARQARKADAERVGRDLPVTRPVRPPSARPPSWR